MDPTMDMFKRDNGCPSGYFRSGDWCYSIWQTVVRWIVIGVCLLLAMAAIAVFVIRRRRMRNNAQPAYAPGWAPQPMPMGAYPPPPPGGMPGAPAPDYYASEQGKPPAYGQQPSYGAPGYGAPGYGAPGYGAPGYGGQEYGVQQPQPAYQPPEGPPPAK